MPRWEILPPHTPEQVKVVLDAAIPEWTVLAGLRQSSAIDAHVVGILIVDISLACPDQILRPRIKLHEIIGRVVEVLAPIEAQPAHVALDSVDIFLLFLGRIGVVETQMAAPVEFLGDPEVQANGLRVTNMQVAVWLRRKACHNTLFPTRIEVRLDDVPNEIAARLRYRHVA